MKRRARNFVAVRAESLRRECPSPRRYWTRSRGTCKGTMKNEKKRLSSLKDAFFEKLPRDAVSAFAESAYEAIGNILESLSRVLRGSPGDPIPIEFAARYVYGARVDSRRVQVEEFLVGRVSRSSKSLWSSARVGPSKIPVVEMRFERSSRCGKRGTRERKGGGMERRRRRRRKEREKSRDRNFARERAREPRWPPRSQLAVTRRSRAAIIDVPDAGERAPNPAPNAPAITRRSGSETRDP